MTIILYFLIYLLVVSFFVSMNTFSFFYINGNELNKEVILFSLLSMKVYLLFFAMVFAGIYHYEKYIEDNRKIIFTEKADDLIKEFYLDDFQLKDFSVMKDIENNDIDFLNSMYKKNNNKKDELNIKIKNKYLDSID